MAISTFIKNKTEDLGKSKELNCPKCHQLTFMQMFANYDLDNYLAQLFDKDEDFNFAVCPLCAGVFKISNTFVPGTQELREYHLTAMDIK